MVHIPDDILNDIFSRFILPEAKSKKNDPIRVCFAIEVTGRAYLTIYLQCLILISFCAYIENAGLFRAMQTNARIQLNDRTLSFSPNI